MTPRDLSWFDTAYLPKLGARAPSMRLALALAPANGAIVETGSIREPDNWAGDGCGTVILADFARREHLAFSTVDISPEVTRTAKASVNGHAACVTEDSVQFLLDFPDPIGLLYLDSRDAYEDGSPEHQLQEVQAAWPHLVPGAVVLLDDNFQGGKTALAKEWLGQRRAKHLIDGHQSLWVVWFDGARV